MDNIVRALNYLKLELTFDVFSEPLWACMSCHPNKALTRFFCNLQRNSTLAGTAERNLEWGDPSSRAERAIHLEGSERIGPGKFWKLKLWKCDFLRFGHQILVTVLVTLQDLVTLWPKNAVRNCVCGKKWGAPPGPPQLRGLCLGRWKIGIYTCFHHRLLIYF